VETTKVHTHYHLGRNGLRRWDRHAKPVRYPDELG
jgi:hypothetical protein